jgi:peptidoglycan/xylan/chitin deacetylase (PgdA/CDA1 family)
MTLRNLLSLSLILSGSLTMQARAQIAWPQDRTAALVLTYDDALKSQLDIAIPQLNEAGFKGTFFLDGDITPAEMRRWRTVQRAGHELGNHSVFHPCPRNLLPDRPQFFTENYDVSRMLGEIAVMNNVLFGIDGQEVRAYSVPCSQMLVGGVDYTEPLRRSGLVKFVRTGGDQYKSVISEFKALDAFQVPSWGPVDGPDGPALIAYVQRVEAARGLGVLQFHGTGGDYLAVSADAHRQLLQYLRQHPRIWVARFSEVMDYVVAGSR